MARLMSQSLLYGIFIISFCFCGGVAGRSLQIDAEGGLLFAQQGIGGGYRFRRLLQDNSTSNQPVAVLLSIADANSLTEDPLTGGIVSASLLDPAACVKSNADFGVLDPSLETIIDASACASQATNAVIASSSINLLLKVNALLTSLPDGAVSATNGATVTIDGSAPYIEGSYSVFKLNVELAGENSPTSISVAENALEEAVGNPTAASNTITALWDTEGPKPTIRTPYGTAATSESKPTLLIDFGERVVASDPTALFSISESGFSRADLIYDVSMGQLYILAEVANPDNSSIITITVPEGATTDIAGNPSSEATYEMSYVPKSDAASTAGTAMNGVLAASGLLMAAGSVMGGVSAPMLTHLLGRVQTAYLTGQLQNMPPNMKTFSDSFSYIMLDYPIPGVDPTSSGQDALNALRDGSTVFPPKPTAYVVRSSGAVENLRMNRAASLISGQPEVFPAQVVAPIIDEILEEIPPIPIDLPIVDAIVDPIIEPLPDLPIPEIPIPVDPALPLPVVPINPIAPLPVVPVPITPIPITPVPITPVPITPLPIVPINPVAPLPNVPVPVVPTPVPVAPTPVPVVPVPVVPSPPLGSPPPKAKAPPPKARPPPPKVKSPPPPKVRSPPPAVEPSPPSPAVVDAPPPTPEEVPSPPLGETPPSPELSPGASPSPEPSPIPSPQPTPEPTPEPTPQPTPEPPSEPPPEKSPSPPPRSPPPKSPPPKSPPPKSPPPKSPPPPPPPSPPPPPPPPVIAPNRALLVEDSTASSLSGWNVEGEWDSKSLPNNAPECLDNGFSYPTGDHTGGNNNDGVIGVATGGCASTTAHEYNWLTTPKVDTDGEDAVKLVFWQWLTTGVGRTETIEVWDGTAWRQIFTTSSASDTAWTKKVFDLKQYANTELQVRFGEKVDGNTAVSAASWILDDICIGTTVVACDNVANGGGSGRRLKQTKNPDATAGAASDPSDIFDFIFAQSPTNVVPAPTTSPTPTTTPSPSPKPTAPAVVKPVVAREPPVEPVVAQAPPAQPIASEPPVEPPMPVVEQPPAAPATIPAAPTSSDIGSDGTGRIYVVSSIGEPQTPPEPAPTDGTTQPTSEQASSEVADIVGALNDQFSSVDTGSAADPLWNTLFWSAIGLAGLLVLHSLMRGIAVWRGMRVPDFLYWPRMELILMGLLVPIIACGAAGLIGLGSPGAKAAGIIFAVVLPLIYFGIIIWLVLWYVAFAKREQSPAIYIVDAEVKAAREAEHARRLALDQQLEGSDEEAPNLKAGDSPSSSHSVEEYNTPVGTPSAAVAAAGGGTASPAPAATEVVTTGAPVSPRTAASRAKDMRPWLERYFLGPVMGYRPSEAGHWVPGTPHDAAFLSSYGVLFDASKGPYYHFQDGTYASTTTEAGGRAVDRGQFVKVPGAKSQRAREISQLLGVAVSGLKIVLFANLLAGLSYGVAPLVPVILMLCLSIAYFAWMRIVCPPHTIVDLLVEIVSILCDIGTFVCGIMAVTTASSDVDRLTSLGWAMVVFQIVGMITTIVPPILTIFMLTAGFMVSLFEKQQPADKFADAVWAVMAADTDMLTRKYADRWVFRVLGRGLHGRVPLPQERPNTVLPFSMKTAVAKTTAIATLSKNALRRTVSLNSSRRRDTDVHVEGAAVQELPPVEPLGSIAEHAPENQQI